jgi:hypothetical protein
MDGDSAVRGWKSGHAEGRRRQGTRLREERKLGAFRFRGPAEIINL